MYTWKSSFQHAPWQANAHACYSYSTWNTQLLLCKLRNMLLTSLTLAFLRTSDFFPSHPVFSINFPKQPFLCPTEPSPQKGPERQFRPSPSARKGIACHARRRRALASTCPREPSQSRRSIPGNWQHHPVPVRRPRPPSHPSQPPRSRPPGRITKRPFVKGYAASQSLACFLHLYGLLPSV